MNCASCGAAARWHVNITGPRLTNSVMAQVRGELGLPAMGQLGREAMDLFWVRLAESRKRMGIDGPPKLEPLCSDCAVTFSALPEVESVSPFGIRQRLPNAAILNLYPLPAGT